MLSPTPALFLSVIVPVHNGSATLADCLAALVRSQFDSFEILVADDASTDGSAEIAAQFPCQVLRLDANHGAGTARNHAARCAHGSILFFLDADVRLQPDSLARIAEIFRTQPDLSALFGSYSQDTVPANFFTEYKNLAHYYTHQTASPDAITFFSSAGAIRRATFEACGGFDESRAALEDIELGYRLHLAGQRIWLNRDLQFMHLKKYTFASLVASDFFNRAIPWTGLMLEKKIYRSDLNTKSNNIVSVGLAFLLLGSPLYAGAHLFGLWLAVCCVAAFIALNWDFFSFVRRTRGNIFLLKSIAMHWFYYIYSGVGLVAGVLIFLFKRRGA